MNPSGLSSFKCSLANIKKEQYHRLHLKQTKLRATRKKQWEVQTGGKRRRTPTTNSFYNKTLDNNASISNNRKSTTHLWNLQQKQFAGARDECFSVHCSLYYAISNKMSDLYNLQNDLHKLQSSPKLVMMTAGFRHFLASFGN